MRGRDAVMMPDAALGSERCAPSVARNDSQICEWRRLAPSRFQTKPMASTPGCQPCTRAPKPPDEDAALQAQAQVPRSVLSRLSIRMCAIQRKQGQHLGRVMHLVQRPGGKAMHGAVQRASDSSHRTGKQAKGAAHADWETADSDEDGAAPTIPQAHRDGGRDRHRGQKPRREQRRPQKRLDEQQPWSNTAEGCR